MGKEGRKKRIRSNGPFSLIEYGIPIPPPFPPTIIRIGAIWETSASLIIAGQRLALTYGPVFTEFMSTLAWMRGKKLRSLHHRTNVINLIIISWRELQ